MGYPRVRRERHRPFAAGRPSDARPLEQGPTRGVTLRFIRPGKPIGNAYVKSFNGRFRHECLNEDWFVSVVDAKATSKLGGIDDNANVSI
jgi:putative transposase